MIFLINKYKKEREIIDNNVICPSLSDLLFLLCCFQPPHQDNVSTINQSSPDFTGLPDVTECVHNTILTWVPCGFLIVFAPVYALILMSLNSPALPWNGLNISKSVSLLFE